MFYLVLNNPTPGFDACFEGSVFARASKEIEVITNELRIKSVFALFSYAAQNDLCPSEFKEEEIPWFDPEEGIVWLTAVIGHVRAHPSAVKHPDRLTAELIRCEGILRQAKTIGAKWHFEMDI